MEPCKTQVWIIPEKKQIVVDDHIGGVPVGVCNLSEANKKIVQQMGGHKEFDYWEEAVSYASKLCQENKGWDYKTYSMMDEYDDDDDEEDYGFDDGDLEYDDWDNEIDIGEFHPKDWN
jgi:hypothetical protein